jgi:hypothetical protein
MRYKMATMVGTQKSFTEAIKELVELDYDALGAYEAAINSPSVKSPRS